MSAGPRIGPRNISSDTGACLNEVRIRTGEERTDDTPLEFTSTLHFSVESKLACNENYRLYYKWEVNGPGWGGREGEEFTVPVPTDRNEFVLKPKDHVHLEPNNYVITLNVTLRDVAAGGEVVNTREVITFARKNKRQASVRVVGRRQFKTGWFKFTVYVNKRVEKM